jgi:hypothetical protein
VMESRRVSGQIHLYWRIRRANGRIFRVKPVALPVSGPTQRLSILIGAIRNLCYLCSVSEPPSLYAREAMQGLSDTTSDASLSVQAIFLCATAVTH